MPLYLWKGPGEMEEVDLARARVPDLVSPTSPTDSPEVNPVERTFHCTVDGCSKHFKKAMIMARHFNSAHSGLKENKDTWREYVDEKVT